MNIIYALVWNEKTKSLVVASEFAKSCRKTLTRGKVCSSLTIPALVLALSGGGAPAAYAYQINGTAGTPDSIAIGGEPDTCAASTDGDSGKSIAIGCGAAATGAPNGVAIGSDAAAQKTNAVAIGNGAKAVKESSIAIGTGSVAGDISNNYDFQIAIGNNAAATAQNSLAIGDQAKALGVQSTAVGSGATALNAQSTAFGRLSAAGNNGTAIGMNAKASGTRSTAIGQGAVAAGTDGTALGQGTNAAGKSAVALGLKAQATTENSVALGTNSATGDIVATPSVNLGGITYDFAGAVPAGTVSVGTVGSERTITNVAAGQLSAASTDAVNGSQLYATNQALDFAVRYDKTSDDAVNLNQITLGGGAAGTIISNLKAGDVSATSTDAVNGSQLNDTNINVAGNTQNIANNTADIATNTSDIATNSNNIGQLQNDALLWDASANGGAGAFSANHGGSGPNRITNVAAGDLSAASTDAVNGSQLNTTNTNVAGNTQNIANNTADIATNTSDIATNTADITTNSDNIGQLQNDALLWDGSANGGAGAFSANHGGSGPNRITNVAAGELSDTSTDAVNGSQLNTTNANVAGNTQNIANNTADIATNTSDIATNTADISTNTTNIGQLQNDALLWDGSANGGAGAFSANHGGSGPNRITNVAAGELSDTSTDAVNGSQLNTTNTNVAGNTQNIANNTADIAANTSDIATNTADITTNSNNIGQLQNDALLWDASANGGAGAFSANHAGSGPNRIANVAAGELSDTSTDAVNGSQLNTTNTNVAGNTQNIANNTADIATNTSDIATNTADITTNSNNIGQLQNDALLWDASANGGAGAFNANHGGNGPNRITNVAAGELSDTSTDAVNGSQLNTTNTNVAGNTQNIANNTSDIAGNTQNIANNTADIATNTADITTNTSNIGQLQNDALLWDGSANGGAGAFSANHGGNGPNRITNVAAGELSAASTDAVNGSQLYSTNQTLESLNTSVGGLGDFAVRYDKNGDGSVNLNQITLGGGAAGTIISNLAAGELSDTSTDAVNGSQLNTTNTNVAGNTQNIANNTADIAANTSDIATNTADITTNSNNIGQLQNDALLWDASANGGAGAFSANHMGSGPNRITNVAAGELSDTSTDAVNGSQLNTTNTSVAANTQNIASNTADIATNTNNIGQLQNDALLWDASTNGGAGAFSANHAGSGPNRITNVAPGELSAASTDAVNGSQLYSTNQTLESLNTSVGGLGDFAVRYDKNGDGSVNLNQITLGGGVAGTLISNLAPGELSDTSTDAVNGSQLNATNNNVETNSANIAANTGSIGQLQNDALLWDPAANGGAGAFSANHAGSGPNRITNVAAGELSATSTDAVNGSQLSATNDNVATNTADIATNTGSIGQLQNDALLWDPSANGGAGAFSANHMGSGPNRITNVAPGELSAASTDAVNGSQLYSTNQTLESLNTSVGGLGDFAVRYDQNSDGSVNRNQITLGGTDGTRITNVAPGELSGTSTDAVNGSQLSATNDNVAANTQNIATNTADIATNTSNIGQLRNDALLWDPAANGGSGAFSANHMGNGASRITNVADGELSDTSTDAVNGSQLYNGIKDVGDNLTALRQDALLWNPTLGAYSAAHGTAPATKITNVAAGDITASSLDAVNGSQLYTTNNRVSQIENTLTNIDQTSSRYVSVNSNRGVPTASGSEAIAIGPEASAAGSGAIALGNNAQSSGESAVAMGNGAGAAGANSTAVGSGSNASADNAVALGAGSVADRNNTVSVGSADNQRQITNVAAGTEDTDAVNVAQLRDVTRDVTGDISRLSEGTDGMFQVNNTAAAPKPRASGSQSLAGGAGAVAGGNNSMAVGMQAQATGNGAVALGNGSVASGQNSVALGANSLADRDNTVSVGYAGGERQISHVAAGTMGTDAVNLNQLQDGIKSANQYTNEKFSSLKKRIDDNKDKMSAGIAGAMAMASLTQPYSPGASMMSIGTAAYQNQSAIALGVSTISESGKWVTKLSGNSNTQGDMGIGLGVGYQW
ncbi:YadA-like family protein [Pluralibacter gergoviae]